MSAPDEDSSADVDSDRPSPWSDAAARPNSTLKEAFRNAALGFRAAVRSERNLRVHLALGGVALLLGALLGLTPWEWALILGATAGVLAAELLNTAIEQLLDHLAPHPHPEVGLSKDISAAGVLVASLGALGVGLLVFVPRIYTLILTWRSG